MPAAEEIYRTVTATQERFAYFFLAAAGGAIAFALRQTEGQPAAGWMFLTALAVIAWGVSFYFGANHLLHRTSILHLNFQRQQIVEGNEGRLVGQPAVVSEEAVKRIDARAEARQMQSSWNAKGQFRLFFVGAAIYIVGHVWRVWTTT